MSGVLVTIDSKGVILRRSALLSHPLPTKYPKHWLSGDITYFFPGASITKFPVGAVLKEIPHA